MTVDEYIETRVAPAHRPTVAILRELMKQHAPDAQEVIAYGSLAWRGAKNLAIVSAAKTHITFAFDRGAEFTDAHGLLDGVGKKTRHVKLKKPDDIDRAALGDYITQAVELDRQ
ncbi:MULTISPECIES: DUF1801 domain-containing protein [Actinokineospora]|uniref:YdhG-like domain-containing protein n=1 Tax=Actinokineospora fastidiosa TaxID=1816 RepID=A0A918G945_9PSEU|nr:MULTISPECIES: DUF1801 domain-containing protein [Actinokineospora]UVS81986.1 hypothetical protein Actkin_05751 [Actinokineospora sp. UTMC 2448]GGS24356.1 hypothetical protein GCM10010171_16890 [Actinokineospora fastidiosa]